MSKITWTDKTDATVSGLAESQKVTASTTAEIKTVVNANDDLRITNTANLQSLALRSGTVPFIYTFSSSTTASDPGAGFFRFDNANPKLATHLYISEEDSNINVQNIMDIMIADSFFYVADREDATTSGLFKVVSVVDNTTWYDFTISASDSATGYNASNLHAVQFLIKGATGAGTGTVTSVTAGNGLAQTGTSTVNPTLLVDYTTVLNLVLSATTDNTVVGSDMILWNDALTSTVYKTEIDNLPFEDGTVTSVASGAGMNFTTVTGTGTVTMGTPTTLTKDTTNATGATTHEHELQITESIMFAVSDEDTDLTTGTAEITFRMPYAFTLTAVRASVKTAPTGSVLTVDINESGTTILSTKITIDATEKTSTTAATAPVISDSSLADDAEMTVDIDGIGSTIAGTGLKVTLIGYKT